jgi:hypothetical protein
VSRTALWYARRGEGEPLVLLHAGGAGVDSRALAPQVEYFADRFEVFTPEPEQRGHGRTPDVEGPLSYGLMVEETVEFVESVVGGPVRLLGSATVPWWRWGPRCADLTWSGGWSWWRCAPPRRLGSRRPRRGAAGVPAGGLHRAEPGRTRPL